MKRKSRKMNDFFPQYTADYISNVMSFRRPQRESMLRLERILDSVELKKDNDLSRALSEMNKLYPICTDFERDFISLTFALATGVGKTRLMGGFITYLYTQKGIRNFFVVAPNTTIYRKLLADLGDTGSEKYVFKGLGCYTDLPLVVTEEAYREATGTNLIGDIRIFIFNIDKFNKEDANMKKENEFIGSSFYQYLAELPDLTVLMDESHHYRADKGMSAINGLKPLLGLELTATPVYNRGSRQVKFTNVVYEYPLSKAIEDGYTRTPYAITRSDINFYNFGDEQTDNLMLRDGIEMHEKIKIKLNEYAHNYSKPLVKPFMLVVCKDTDHAKWVEEYVKSDEFCGGLYRNRTIVIHSKQRGAESEANTKLLLDVEKADNPVEIVIHVNMLKEGWDVNNLYTIVPLRTASSKILREQMVGRGLRLPFGERVNKEDYKELDGVYLTAHDKFDELLKEAQQGDSIFKAGNIIVANEEQKEKVIVTQMKLPLTEDEELKDAYKESGLVRSEENDVFLMRTDKLIKSKITQQIQNSENHRISKEKELDIADEVEKELEDDRDFSEKLSDKWGELGKYRKYLQDRTKNIHREIVNKYIPIPKIKVTDEGYDEYAFADFDIDLSDFTQAPIKNEVLIQSLTSMQDMERVKGNDIDFDGYNPEKAILEYLRKKPEIDYEKCKDMLFKHISAVCRHYESRYGENGMRNIVMMYKREIAELIYKQMMQENHFYYKNGFIREEVIGNKDYNISPAYSYSERVGLYEAYTQKIQSVLFDDIKKGVFSEAKFDSEPELTFAKVAENDNDVKNWLRPAPNEFNITYNHGRKYEPDFVVETDGVIYLVEVKGEDKINDADVIAKKERAIHYCEAATRWGEANGYKKWQYLFIPSKKIASNSSFMHLAEEFGESEKL